MPLLLNSRWMRSMWWEPLLRYSPTKRLLHASRVVTSENGDEESGRKEKIGFRITSFADLSTDTTRKVFEFAHAHKTDIHERWMDPFFSTAVEINSDGTHIYTIFSSSETAFCVSPFTLWGKTFRKRPKPDVEHCTFFKNIHSTLTQLMLHPSVCGDPPCV